MKIKLVLYFFLLSAFANAQAGWLQKANFDGVARYHAVGFSIGTKGYIGTGSYSSSGPFYNDFWEWSQQTNVWTQKANFPGAARCYAIGFSIGTKGYVGTGYGGVFPYYQDFWEWNQATNAWTQKADYGGGVVFGAAAFSIGNKGYVACGRGGGGDKSDFWEYNSSTDAWTFISAFPGPGRRYPVAFSIGTKGYVGTGYISTPTTMFKDFWEWDQATNTWMPKSDVGGAGRYLSAAFSIGNKGYIGLGTVNDFMEWDQATDTWAILPNLPSGFITSSAVGFSIGTNGYVGTGVKGANLTKDFWELSLCDIAISGNASTICIGSNITLNSSFTPASANITYNWVPSSGLNSTTVPNPVATPTSSTVYTLTAQDTSTKCQVSKNFTVSISLPSVSIIGPTQICTGQNVNLCTYGGITYSWSSGQITNCITITPSATTSYSVGVWDASGCYVNDSATVTVNNCSGGIYCSNNEGFENGNFFGWTGESGTNDFANSGTINWTGGINSLGNDVASSSSAQQTMLTINKLDSFTIDATTNQPDIFMTSLAPNTGNYSVRLGNSQPGCGAERLRIPFSPTASDSLFIYQFALVFQNAGHITPHEPGFIVNVYGAANTLYPPLCDTIYGPDPIVPFLSVSPSAPDPSVLYKRWATAVLNFSSFIGQNVTIEFVNFDCGECGHWGYTYLDVSCSNSPTGITFLNPETISVYPNPSSGLFTIKSEKEISSIEILNVLGENIYSASNTLHLKSHEIDLSKQPKGIYFYNLRSENATITTGKLIIQ